MLAHSDDGMLEYYRYLNSGYRLPLVGGTDKMSSAVPVGLYRTYARLDEEFSYEASGPTVVARRRTGRHPDRSAQPAQEHGFPELSRPSDAGPHARPRSG
jgi:hypothetical protein